MNKQVKKFQLLIWGCQMNWADAQRIEQILLDLNYQKTDQESEANVIVVVACSVRQAAVDRVYGKARQWQKRRQQGQLLTILTGCVLDQDKQKLSKIFDQVIDISAIGSLPEILNENLIVKAGDYLCLPACQQSDFSALVPISNGCNNFCSYCAVPYTRGREVSREAKSIIDECQKLIAKGYKEINLLGQNVNSYKNRQYDFPKLLTEIDKINGDYRLRFLTSHPKDLSDQLIKVMATGRHIAPHLHLALQSGDDEILKKMNRHYTAKHYTNIIKQAKKLIPNLVVSTDVIVGFPGETKKQFKNTAELMEKLDFDMAFISQYSPRPQTAALKFKDNISKAEKKQRQEILDKILKAGAFKNNQKYLGLTVRVLVDGYKAGRCFGKAENSKIVAFKGDKSLIGKFVAVKIKQIKYFSLEGELI